MNGVHPSDMELQQYVLDRSACSADVLTHLDGCAECQAGIAAYGVLFGELERQPRPVFDFDVAALVVERVMAERVAIERVTERAAAVPKSRAERRFNLMMGAMIFAIGGIPAWLFRKNAFYVFTGVSAFFLYLMGGAALLIVLLRILAMYKKYQRRMEALQFFSGSAT